jgi:putative colanic acid biosynthesis UDP-glucose lipid carrier transferase
MLELIIVFGIVGMCLTAVGFLTKTSANYSRAAVTIWGMLAFSFLVLQRLFAREMLRIMRAKGRNTRSLAIAGSGPSAVGIARQVIDAEWAGLLVTGFYETTAAVGSKPLAGHDLEVKGDLHELVRLARAGEIDYIYVALPTKDEDRVMWLVNLLADTTASVYVVPDVFIFQLKQARWTSIGGMPIVSIYESPFDGINGWLKRVEDVVLSILILILMAGPMLVIGLITRFTSNGPALFKQRRYGLNGKVVEVWKFRSMRVTEDGDTIMQAQKQDPRITPFGAFLRRTSLDELPQFFNVLKGDMSVVGPRPHAVAHNEQYRGLIPGYMLRHKVKPGITGWAQVNGWRGETDTLEKMAKRVEFDLEYMRNWSLWLDIKIVVLTIFKGFSGKNAY